MKDFYQKKLELHQDVENGKLKGHYPACPRISKNILGTTDSRSLYSWAFYLLSFPNINPFHRLKGDESWQYTDGASLTLHTLNHDENYTKIFYQKIVIGPNLDKDERFVYIVPRNTWMAAEINGKNENDFTLITHFSLPSFHEEDHEKGTYEKLIKNFPNFQNMIKKFQWKE